MITSIKQPGRDGNLKPAIDFKNDSASTITIENNFTFRSIFVREKRLPEDISTSVFQPLNANEYPACDLYDVHFTFFPAWYSALIFFINI